MSTETRINMPLQITKLHGSRLPDAEIGVTRQLTNSEVLGAISKFPLNLDGFSAHLSFTGQGNIPKNEQKTLSILFNRGVRSVTLSGTQEPSAEEDIREMCPEHISVASRGIREFRKLRNGGVLDLLQSLPYKVDRLSGCKVNIISNPLGGAAVDVFYGNEKVQDGKLAIIKAGRLHRRQNRKLVKWLNELSMVNPEQPINIIETEASTPAKDSVIDGRIDEQSSGHESDKSVGGGNSTGDPIKDSILSGKNRHLTPVQVEWLDEQGPDGIG